MTDFARPSRKLVKHPDNTMDIFRPCSITGALYIVRVNAEDITRWKEGMYIQDAFPYLNPDQRDFILLNMTPDEYEMLLPREE